MTQTFAAIELSDIVTLDADAANLSFIQDVEYEFVGGGTAVNCL